MASRQCFSSFSPSLRLFERFNWQSKIGSKISISTHRQVDMLPSQLTHTQGATRLANYQLSYLENSNLLKQLVSNDGTQDFSYDKRDQLIKVTDPAGQAQETYTYGTGGNRSGLSFRSDPYNRLTMDGTYNYGYDPEGNLTQRTNRSTGVIETLSWDHRNRLTQIETQDPTGKVIEKVNYLYDVYDRRIGKTVDPDGAGTRAATTERYVWDGDDLALVFSGNTLKQRYLYGTQVDQVLAEDTGTTVRWALADHQGTIRDVTDANGTLLNHIRYDSFGKVISQTRPTAFFRFGYTGRETDLESGLMYYRARYYDPGAGRFISEDPIGFDGGDANLYRYVGNSPTNYTDAFGLFRNGPARATQVRNASNVRRLTNSVRSRMHVVSGSGLESQGDLDLVQLGGQYAPLTTDVGGSVNYGPGFNLFMYQALMEEIKAIDGINGIASTSTQAGTEAAGKFPSIASSSQQSQTNQYNDLNCNPQPEYCPKEIPTYIEDGAKFPDHARLVDEAQDLGFPEILTKRSKRYKNPLIKKAKADFEDVNGYRPSIVGLDIDEYPYAITEENKLGIYFKPIDWRENQAAGNDLRWWFARNNVKPGCLFRVDVINVAPIQDNQ
jgi:RHS repeat-associated protein